MRRGPGQGAADDVAGAVTCAGLGQALVDRHGLAVGAGGHVAVGQRVGQRRGRGPELAGQGGGEPAVGGLDDGARMMGDQPAQQVVGSLGIPQVAGTIERMESGVADGWRVPDIVQPGGGGQQVGVVVGYGGEGLGGGGDLPDVGPAAGQRVAEQAAGGVLGPGGVAHVNDRMQARPDGSPTCRGVWGRPEDVLARLGRDRGAADGADCAVGQRPRP